MINWINFLHIYQPPRQNKDIFHKVARESYREIAKFFDQYDGLYLTMNLSGSLLEQLMEYHYDELLGRFARAFSSGEMELVGSAMYHPILPFLPDWEIERQIILDEEIKKQVFGSEYKRGGFYLPEMAYSRKVAEILDCMGFKWIILDEISYNGRLGGFDKEKVYKIEGLDLKVIFRDRNVSDYFVPEKIREISQQAFGQDRNIITATDGELYGHHHQDFYNKTKEAFTDGNIRSLRISEFIRQFGSGGIRAIDPVSSSWESNENQIEKGIPYAYWRYPGNELQEKIWSFADFAMNELQKRKNDENYGIACRQLDKGLSSCHFWAASGKNSPIWKETIWNPDSIENGIIFLVRSIRSLAYADIDARMEAERRFLEITKMIWSLHWSRFYKK